MTKDEALRLALEKLTAASNYIDTLGGVSKGYRMDIERIKAALEAKDEPVAWMREDGTLHFADKNIFYVGQPFYTTPPQRKPLTDEEAKDLLKHSDLLDMFEHIGWYSAPKNGFNKHGISLIRAIEAAHGIKGEA
jgi:hypothetical protein